ncbi:hypothetical protein KIV65_gp19 [Mycobacterium phage Anthony]|uniref:Uncharacterized protein n=1 Tax=Mycobacterium phage Anthony TaxID=2599857 RepID=A0A5J6TJ85_9CAUD|nr:hypothetical protein KIV65_gp19 [Mycobacterium phage Anthony]QFG10448.1 hypothetical protein PBI_ANTHONY_78 [Mycobacterium phage Anthony]
MDAKTKKMQDKVAKLLRQAEDVAGTPEEGVFQAKAFELIAKYGLELTQVEATKEGLDTTELPDAIKWIVPITGKYAAAQMQLLGGMAKALHSKCVSSSRGGSYHVIVFGMPRHVERMQFLWSLLQPQMMRLVEKVRPEEGFAPRLAYDYRTGQVRQKNTSGQLKQYRRSWISGFAQTIQERLTAEETKALDAAGGGALVLYRGDKERAEVALRTAYPRLKKARRTTVDPNGYAHGQRDGRSASFARALAV